MAWIVISIDSELLLMIAHVRVQAVTSFRSLPVSHLITDLTQAIDRGLLQYKQ